MLGSLTTLAVLALGSAMPVAAEGCEAATPNPVTGVIECIQSVDPMPRGERRGGSGGGAPPEHLLRQAELLTGTDGICISYRWTDLGRPVTEQDQLGVERTLITWLQAGIPMCPQAEAPLPEPGVVAEEVVRRMQLPVPEPRIEPGRMLVGLRAYLETGGRLDFGHAEETVLGQIDVAARAVVFVDWGDGTQTGPHESGGGPWPVGDITHVYQHAGEYDVVVRYRWVADWAVGGATGTIDTGLETVASIPGFEIEERQAVITTARD